jgi:hypothetical protein
MSWQIQEGVNLGHADSLWTVSNFYNVIARPDFSFLQHPKVESWSVMRYEQGCHPRFIHANAHAVARYARLCHLKYRIANAIAIANADLVIRKLLNGEVFSELAEDEVFTSEKAFPVLIGIPTGLFQIAVRTVLPFHVTSRGRPTFTESNLGIHTSSKSSVWLESLPYNHAELRVRDRNLLLVLG